MWVSFVFSFNMLTFTLPCHLISYQPIKLRELENMLRTFPIFHLMSANAPLSPYIDHGFALFICSIAFLSIRFQLCVRVLFCSQKPSTDNSWLCRQFCSSSLELLIRKTRWKRKQIWWKHINRPVRAARFMNIDEFIRNRKCTVQQHEYMIVYSIACTLFVIIIEKREKYVHWEIVCVLFIHLFPFQISKISSLVIWALVYAEIVASSQLKRGWNMEKLPKWQKQSMRFLLKRRTQLYDIICTFLSDYIVVFSFMFSEIAVIIFHVLSLHWFLPSHWIQEDE